MSGPRCDGHEADYAALEQAMWAPGADFQGLLARYQALFREQEGRIRQRGKDDRHRFILGIPVADRPVHLRACLESLLQICMLYDYGGRTNGVWDKIQVVVAEDSRDEDHIRQHVALVEEYRRQGLQIVHFGLAEQYTLLHALPPATRVQLGDLLTRQPPERFYRKGQAANRNLCYLKFLELTQEPEKTLYYLIDSDQHFCVNRRRPVDECAAGTTGTAECVYALNYFHTIDRIFRDTDTLMLTGKLVGDPPVSPSVMAANFLDDVLAFFDRLARLPGAAVCQFHGVHPPAAAAAYHDLAGLFGFTGAPETFPYVCRLSGPHDHAACLRDFARRLKAFFFGEHLTRKTWFTYGDGFAKLGQARTVYPGNYVINHAGLKYLIPFGHLRLRMSGPTAGRLIAAEIGPRFATCNLPNLHRRISDSGRDGDFRPGVELDAVQQKVDLADEFERQFFGDLMLFTTEALVKVADVTQPFAAAAIEAILAEKEAELLALYRQKHQAVVVRNQQLQRQVFGSGHWWLRVPELAEALQEVQTFSANIARNFGEEALAWRQIESAAHRARRKQQIVAALLNYRAERAAWDSLCAAWPPSDLAA